MGKSDLISRLEQPPELLMRLAQVPGLYLAGGFLRDAWWGLDSRDIDLVATGPLDAALAELQRATGAEPFELGQRFGSHRLVAAGYEIDISQCHVDGIAADMARRDYTVNALMIRLDALGEGVGAEHILHLPDSFDDLDSRTLRMVSLENIADDPARILRGYRLCAAAGLTPEPATRAAWSELAEKVTEAAPERLHEELLRWLGAKRSVAETIGMCAEDGVLWQLFPYLVDTTRCSQNAYHHADVWTHTMEALAALDGMARQVPPELAQHEEELAEAMGEPVSGMASARALTRLALLVHDLGKPQTREEERDGRITFYSHQDVSAELMQPVLEGLKFSNDEIDYTLLLVREHLRLGFYCDLLPVPPKLVYRYIRKLGKATPLAVLHSLADCAATKGPLNEGGWEKHAAAAKQILEHYFAEDVLAAPPVLLDGHQIMELLGIQPGRTVGRLKEQLLEATATGEVETVEQAREYVTQLYYTCREE